MDTLTLKSSAYERWMVRSNVERIESGNATLGETVETLVSRGYRKIAALVALSVYQTKEGA